MKQTQTQTQSFLQEDLDKVSGLFPDICTFTLPTSVSRDISELLRSKKNYTLIASDRVLAIEKCLFLVSNLTSTLFTEEKWKSLSSSILHDQISNYKTILKFLISNSILAVKKDGDREVYQEGVTSKQYRLNVKYDKMSTSVHSISSKNIIAKKNTRFYLTLQESLEDPICNNLINIYPSISIPSESQIKQEAKKLIKSGFQTNKGKILTMRNGHKDSYWKDSSNRSFVEDSIKLFNYLTERGFMIPSSGSSKSGGRVVDSFTLMPSWIRKMITINGNRLVESDYSTLHPNIAKAIYGGSDSNISHDIVSDYLKIDRKVAKIEHLSFFNKRWSHMEKSPLFKYYNENEETMMNNIKKEKFTTSYKETSKRLFKTEVSIMSKVIKELNENGVYALYVYDALYVEPQDVEITTYIMNTVAKEFKVNTTV